MSLTRNDIPDCEVSPRRNLSQVSDTLHKPWTLNPRPQTLDPKVQTLNLEQENVAAAVADMKALGLETKAEVPPPAH